MTVEKTRSVIICDESLFDGIETEVEFDVEVGIDLAELIEGSLSIEYKQLSDNQYKNLIWHINRYIDQNLDDILASAEDDLKDRNEVDL